MNQTAYARGRPLRPLAPVLAALALAACEPPDSTGPSAPGGSDRPPPRVVIERVQPRTVDVRETYAGRARGSREVEVRARVEGILLKRRYIEGQLVENGASLFLIDPKPFKVALRRAEAELQTAEANLRQAQREWRRVSDLYEQDAISTRERDQARSALELGQAEVAMAQAMVEQAQIELDYTDVEAPLRGVTSLEAVPEGSLVSPGDLLTTVTQLDPIHVRFALPERDALAQREARRAMTNGEDADTKRSAVLILPNGERYGREGRVDFTDASIDPDTGTVRARAVFPNPDNELTPGLFVRVELRTATLEDVAVIPERAVTSGPDGPTVFVVGTDDQVSATPVELGPVVDAGQVIQSGLEDGDRLVVAGVSGLQDGMEVEVEKEDGGRSD